jgi:hypothetical protein
MIVAGTSIETEERPVSKYMTSMASAISQQIDQDTYPLQEIRPRMLDARADGAGINRASYPQIDESINSSAIITFDHSSKADTTTY